MNLIVYKELRKRKASSVILLIVIFTLLILLESLILFAFGTMVVDGIKPLTISYAYFMSYFICGIVLIYLISYKILLRYN